MNARLAFVASVFALCAGAALWRCSDDGAGGDAGDAVADVGGEVRYLPEAGEAGTDGADGSCSVTSDWPGFRRLTEFDPCSSADVLVELDAGYDMTWTDCDEGGDSGCKQLAQLAPGVFTYAYATHDDGGSGAALFLDQGTAVNATARQFDLLDLKTSKRVGEWRVDTNDSTQVALANSPDEIAIFLGYKPGLYVDVAPAQALSTSPLSLTPFPTAPTQPINWALSPQIMAWQPFSAPYSICKVDAGTCVPMNTASIAPAVLYLTFAWGDVAFAVSEHGTAGWAQEYVVHADGSISLLRSNPNAHVWAMVTDGTTLVWKEVYGSQNLSDAQTKAEVWTAPFTTDKATLDQTATKLTTLPTAGLGGGPGISEVAFFNGLYATYFGGYPYQFTIYTVDVTTGQIQSSPTGPGGIVLGLPYVDRNELWEITSTVSYLDSLVRIPFAQPWN